MSQDKSSNEDGILHSLKCGLSDLPWIRGVFHGIKLIRFINTEKQFRRIYLIHSSQYDRVFFRDFIEELNSVCENSDFEVICLNWKEGAMTDKTLAPLYSGGSKKVGAVFLPDSFSGQDKAQVMQFLDTWRRPTVVLSAEEEPDHPLARRDHIHYSGYRNKDAGNALGEEYINTTEAHAGWWLGYGGRHSERDEDARRAPWVERFDQRLLGLECNPAAPRESAFRIVIERLANHPLERSEAQAHISVAIGCADDDIALGVDDALTAFKKLRPEEAKAASFSIYTYDCSPSLKNFCSARADITSLRGGFQQNPHVLAKRAHDFIDSNLQGKPQDPQDLPIHCWSSSRPA